MAGSISARSAGPAAVLAQNNITKVEVLEYPELGMEAVWKIEVKNFPAFIIVDDKGNDFFRGPRNKHLMKFTVDRIDHVVMTCARTSPGYRRLGTSGAGHGARGIWRQESHGTAFRRRKDSICMRWGIEVSPHATIAKPGTLDLCFVIAVGPEDAMNHLRQCGVEIERGPVSRIGRAGGYNVGLLP